MGVVGDVRMASVEQDVRPAIYLGSVGLPALVVSRQFIMLVDNDRLIDRLELPWDTETGLRLSD